MSLVDDRAELDTSLLPNGQQKSYLVLSEAERAKGFVRPVRHAYKHVGPPGPATPLEPLTEIDRKSGVAEEFVGFERFADGGGGRYWAQAELDKVGKGCGTVTTMAPALAETYAREPGFYGGTFCVGCRVHLPVGERGEFVWTADGTRVGT